MSLFPQVRCAEKELKQFRVHVILINLKYFVLFSFEICLSDSEGITRSFGSFNAFRRLFGSVIYKSHTSRSERVSRREKHYFWRHRPWPRPPPALPPPPCFPQGEKRWRPLGKKDARGPAPHKMLWGNAWACGLSFQEVLLSATHWYFLSSRDFSNKAHSFGKGLASNAFLLHALECRTSPEVRKEVRFIQVLYFYYISVIFII